MPPLPAVYLLPGLLCDRQVWAHQIEALSRDFEVHVADFRDFDDISRMADAVLAGAPGRFSLAGHSMGARVALEIVRLAPDRLLRLALLDTGTHPMRESEPKARQALVDLAYKEGMAALAARWLPPMVHPDRATADSFMRPLRAMVCRMTPEIHERQIKALLTRPDTAPALAAIRCPVLIGVGRQDAWSPVSQHEAITRLLPGSRLVIFEESGHMAPVEAPQAVTKALLDWMHGPSA